jgi:hypothetical protein
MNKFLIIKMKKLKYWIRWVVVLPGAIISGILAIFPLHWALHATFVRGSMISGMDIKPIEYFLYPFVVAIIYIVAGFKIAPKHKFKTASILFVFYVLFWITITYTMWGNGYIDNVSWRSIFALMGAIIGLYISKKKSNFNN